MRFLTKEHKIERIHPKEHKIERIHPKEHKIERIHPKGHEIERIDLKGDEMVHSELIDENEEKDGEGIKKWGRADSITKQRLNKVEKKQGRVED